MRARREWGEIPQAETNAQLQARTVAAVERIAAARRWVHFDNYIIRSDATGSLFADALIERARAGVAVRVLTDPDIPASAWSTSSCATASSGTSCSSSTSRWPG